VIVSSPLIRNCREVTAMNSTLVWPALTVLGLALASIPAVEDAGNRTLLYWVFVPSLLVGVVVICTGMRAF